MKTRSIYKHLLAVVLMLSAVQTIQAQDAFYIYRNDGDFNGFFYDEIVRMGYSKFDLDSVEHDVFVVQEIETADSLYRIPLAAIDSIGFQQPEIRFSKNFHNFDELGILPEYIKVWDRKQIYLYLPKEFDWRKLKFKKGDTFATMTAPMSNEIGFSGKFTEVYDMKEYTDSYMEKPPVGSHVFRLRFTPLDSYGDVFDQFITTERIYTDNVGNVRRRIAGCNPDGTPRRSIQRSYEGGQEQDLITITSTISRSWEPTDGVNIDLGADVEMKIGMQVTYNCSWRRIYVKFEIPADFSVTPTLGIKASKSFEATVDGVPKFLKAIKFPIQCPIFQTLPIPEIVVRGGGELSAKVNFPKVGYGIATNIVFDSDNTLYPAQFYISKHESGDKASGDAIDTGSAEFCLSGYMQMALKFSANIETCDWFSNLFFCRIGLDFFVGPKVQGGVKLASFSAYKDNPNSIYSAFVGNGIDITGLSCDLEGTTTLGYLFKDKEKRQFLSSNLSFFQVPFKLIPQAINTTYEAIPGYPQGRVKAKLTTKNRSLLPTFVGVKASNTKYNPKYYGPTYSYQARTFAVDSVTSEIDMDLPPGHYRFKPYFKTMGIEYEIPGSAENWNGYEGHVSTELDLLPAAIEEVEHVCKVPVHRTINKKGTKTDGTNFDTTEESDYVFYSNNYDIHYYLKKIKADIRKSGDDYVITGEETIGDETMKLNLTIKLVNGLAYITDGSLEYTKSQSGKYENDGHTTSGRNAKYHYTREWSSEKKWTYSFRDVTIQRRSNDDTNWDFCGFNNENAFIPTKKIDFSQRIVSTQNEQWDYTALNEPYDTWTEKADSTETTTDEKKDTDEKQFIQFTLSILTPEE